MQATFAVLITSIVIVAVFGYVGVAVHAGGMLLLRRASDARLTLSFVWIGLTAIVAYIQLWSLIAPVGVVSWFVPIALACGGVWIGGPPRLAAWRISLADNCTRVAIPVAVLLCVWVANRSVLPISHPDSTGYHLSAIQFASEYGTVPGLGNLHHRLGSNVAHLLFVAFVGVGPWTGHGFHLANGLIATLSVVECLWRCAGLKPTIAWIDRLLAALVLLTVSTFVFYGPTFFVSSPSLDFPAMMLFGVASLYLLDARAGTNGMSGVLAIALMSLLAASRLQFLPAVAATAGIVLWTYRTAWSRTQAWLAVTGPLVVIGGSMMRTVILSGYPLFPSTIGGFKFDWTMPPNAVHEFARSIRSWARTPGEDPSDVLDSWDWMGPWTRALTDTLIIREMIVAVSVGLCVALGALAVTILRGRMAELRTRLVQVDLRAITTMVLPGAATLLLWFFTAPDPRFVYGPLLIVPFGLLFAAGQIVARRAWSSICCVAALVGFASSINVSSGLGWGWITFTGSGPFGSSGVSDPAMDKVEMPSGLVILTPIEGGPGQCMDVILCTPVLPDDLELRGDDVGSGFRHP